MPYMTKQTITYSDGTETVISYKENENSEEIEKTVAEEIEAHRGESAKVVEEVTASEVVSEVEDSTASEVE